VEWKTSLSGATAGQFIRKITGFPQALPFPGLFRLEAVCEAVAVLLWRLGEAMAS
jgi:hypothetical protein